MQTGTDDGLPAGRRYVADLMNHSSNWLTSHCATVDGPSDGMSSAVCYYGVLGNLSPVTNVC